MLSWQARCAGNLCAYFYFSFCFFWLWRKCQDSILRVSRVQLIIYIFSIPTLVICNISGAVLTCSWPGLPTQGGIQTGQYLYQFSSTPSLGTVFTSSGFLENNPRVSGQCRCPTQLMVLGCFLKEYIFKNSTKTLSRGLKKRTAHASSRHICTLRCQDSVSLEWWI